MSMLLARVELRGFITNIQSISVMIEYSNDHETKRRSKVQMCQFTVQI